VYDGGRRRIVGPAFEMSQMQPNYYAARIMPTSKDAWRLRRFATPNAHVSKLVRDLMKASDAYEELETLARGMLFQKARYDDDTMVAIDFTQNIVRIMKSNFGKRMYSTVATIASVVLLREITFSDVRVWCRGPFQQA
jgi:hypothetical protein